MTLKVTLITKKSFKSKNAIARQTKLMMNNQVALNLVAKMRAHHLDKKNSLKSIEKRQI